MACGCQTAGCGCNVTAGPGILVQRIGDNFIITNLVAAGGAVPVFVQETQPLGIEGPYVWYELNNLGETIAVWVENGLP